MSGRGDDGVPDRHRGRHAVASGSRALGRSLLGWVTATSPFTLARRALVVVMSAAMLATTGMSWVTLGSLRRDLNTTNALDPAPSRKAAPGQSDIGDGATDILLVGSDSRTDAQGRPLPLDILRQLRTEQSVGLNTDTIILVRIPDNGTAAHAVSIPRDTYVSIPGRGEDKINSAYGMAQAAAARQMREQGVTDEDRIERDSAHAGRRALVTTVQDLTGVHIDHYAEVNLYGFALLTEAIGGVQVCLNAPTKDSGSGADFPAGRQTLSGGAALSFVRQRGGLPRGDLDRIVRQQVFMASAVREVLSAGTLADPGRLSALADTAKRSLVLDDGWDVLGFAQQLQGIAAGAVDFVTIPVENVGAHDDQGRSIITVDLAQVRAFVANLAGRGGPATHSGTHSGTHAAAAAPGAAPAGAAPAGTGTLRGNLVDVYNGTDSAGLAGEVAAKLAGAGMVADQVGDIERRSTTAILVAPGRIALGRQVADLLGGAAPVTESPRLAPDRVEVLLGSDYPALGGQRFAAAPALRLDGTATRPGTPPAPPAPRPPTAPQPPPISADGVPCIN